MPKTPSAPKLPPRTFTGPRPQEAALDSARDAELQALKKRRGFASTFLTRGVNLGPATTEKARALGA
jgi:hypothetical protein